VLLRCGEALPHSPGGNDADEVLDTGRSLQYRDFFIVKVLHGGLVGVSLLRQSRDGGLIVLR
jgi:hypothetical protein